jgi:hypothetical protein
MAPGTGQVGAVLSLQKGNQRHHPLRRTHDSSPLSIRVDGRNKPKQRGVGSHRLGHVTRSTDRFEARRSVAAVNTKRPPDVQEADFAGTRGNEKDAPQSDFKPQQPADDEAAS